MCCDKLHDEWLTGSGDSFGRSWLPDAVSIPEVTCPWLSVDFRCGRDDAALGFRKENVLPIGEYVG